MADSASHRHLVREPSRGRPPRSASRRWPRASPLSPACSYVPPSHLQPGPPRARAASPPSRRARSAGCRIMVDAAHAIVAFALPPTTRAARPGTGHRGATGRRRHRRDRRPARRHPDGLPPAVAEHRPERAATAESRRRVAGRPAAGETDARTTSTSCSSACSSMKGSDLHLAGGRQADGPRPRPSCARSTSSSASTPTRSSSSSTTSSPTSRSPASSTSASWTSPTRSPSQSRFRMNVFRQRGSVGAVLRVIPFEIPPFEQPRPARQRAPPHRPAARARAGDRADRLGQVDHAGVAARHHQSHQGGAHHLVRGPHRVPAHPPAGASSTSARSARTPPRFASALRRVLREDPDVILVGEMRDLETIQMALTAAETGHLVFGTLHTQSAPQTVERIVDVFPPEQQGQIRVMLGHHAAGGRHPAAAADQGRRRAASWPPRCSWPRRPCATSSAARQGLPDGHADAGRRRSTAW